MKKLLGLTSILLATGLAASASPVTPPYSYFGKLSDATFAGTGIPNNAVAVTTIQDGTATITLGLTAFGRYDNTLEGNNGAGVFYASPGANYGDPNNPTTPSPSKYLGSTWDFGFFIGVASDSAGIGDPYTFTLTYGDASAQYTVDPAQIAALDYPATQKVENSYREDAQNLLFGNFAGIPNNLNFNPNADGTYSFELQAYNGDQYLGETAINVDVPDTGSTGWLLGLGFAGLVVFGFRQKRLQAVS